MNKEILNLGNKIVYYPIRHHSPTSTRILINLITLLKPEWILLEGPSDFNNSLHELHLQHTLPIAIYSYILLDNHEQLGAFYPLCEYSPEFQALKIAKENNISMKFIDLPWSEIAITKGNPGDQYTDFNLKNGKYISILCQKLGVDNFNDVWDEIVEIDSTINIEEYFSRVHQLCYSIRKSEKITQTVKKRETFMASQIKAINESSEGKILVITGGFHSYALFTKLNNKTILNNSEISTQKTLFTILEKDITLTPYSYDKLDRQTGYEAGLPNPGFYHHVWQTRNKSSIPHENAVWKSMQKQLITALRNKKIFISTEDIIAINTMAIGLAKIRSHKEIWRQDIIDGLTSTLIKNEILETHQHPFIEITNQIFKGNQLGKLHPSSSSPPLLKNIMKLLTDYQIYPNTTKKKVVLDLLDNHDQQISQLLHKLLFINISGINYISGTNFTTTEDLSNPNEKWELVLTPDFEAACLEASIYGVSLEKAALEKMRELLFNQSTNAMTATSMLIQAEVMGIIPYMSIDIIDQCITHITSESNFYHACKALSHLVYLYHYEEVINLNKNQAIEKMVINTYEYCILLLGNIQNAQKDPEKIISALSILLEAKYSCNDLLISRNNIFLNQLKSLLSSNNSSPFLRGIAFGILWNHKAINDQQRQKYIHLLSQPENFGSFLSGVFQFCRETIQLQSDFLNQINNIIVNFSEEEFLEALPSLRNAFSAYTPREKHYLAISIFETAQTYTSDNLNIMRKIPNEIIEEFEDSLLSSMSNHGIHLSSDYKFNSR